jgi:hypothetical protein
MFYSKDENLQKMARHSIKQVYDSTTENLITQMNQHFTSLIYNNPESEDLPSQATATIETIHLLGDLIVFLTGD